MKKTVSIGMLVALLLAIALPVATVGPHIDMESLYPVLKRLSHN